MKPMNKSHGLSKMTPAARARHARMMMDTASTTREQLKWMAEANRWQRRASAVANYEAAR